MVFSQQFRPFLACFTFALLLSGSSFGLENADSKSPQETPDATLNKVVRLTNGYWPPFLSPELPGYGIGSNIVTQAFNTMGYSVEYGFYPWKRSFDLASKGYWDGTVLWVKTPEREKQFFYSLPVIESKYVLLHLKSFKLVWESIEDLGPLKICAAQGYYIGEAFEVSEKKGLLKVDRVPSERQCIDLLLRNRVDVVPINLSVVHSLLEAHFNPYQIGKLTYNPKILRTSTTHLLLSRKKPQNEILMDIFNKGLKKLEEDGTLDKNLRANDKHRASLKPTPESPN